MPASLPPNPSDVDRQFFDIVHNSLPELSRRRFPAPRRGISNRATAGFVLGTVSFAANGEVITSVVVGVLVFILASLNWRDILKN